jgi:hypothetical protein
VNRPARRNNLRSNPPGSFPTQALIAYWPGNEASGNLLDAHTNGLDLTDTGTVTNNTGNIYPTARQYDRDNHEYFTRDDEDLLSFGDTDWTLAAWVYLDNKDNGQFFVSKDGNASNKREVQLCYVKTPTDRFKAWVFTGSADAGNVAANNLGSPSAGTWYFIVLWHDPTANTLNIQVNNGAIDSAATTAAMGDGTAAFRIGSIVAWSVYDMDGRIGPVGFWKSAAGGGGILTPAQRAWLYNNGAGRRFP